MFDFLSQKFSSLFSRLTAQNHLSEDNIREALEKVKEALLEADVPYDVIESFMSEVRQEIVGKKIINSLKPAEMLVKVVHEKILQFLGGTASDSPFQFQMPSIVMVMVS